MPRQGLRRTSKDSWKSRAQTTEFSNKALKIGRLPSEYADNPYVGVYLNGSHLVGGPEKGPGYLSTHLKEHLATVLIDAVHRCVYEALNLEDIRKDRASASGAIKRYEEFGKEELKEAKRRLEAPRRGGRESHYDFSRLLEYYDQYHPMWKRASALFTSSRFKNVTVRERLATVKATFPDLPEDLIQRIGLVDRYWRMPSFIAAEHAGRLCGLPSDRDERNYSPEYLLGLTSKMRVRT